MQSKANEANQKSEKARDLEVFISHPHRYKELADVLRKTIIEWSNGRIMPHQTSEAGATPLAVGDPIRPHLEECLRRSSVVLLLYVSAELANYCMYEAGVAAAQGEGPLSNKRLVVFQCGSEIPSVFKDELLVRLTKEGIKKFTVDFHRTPKFFRTLGHAFAPHLTSEFIERRGQKLFLELSDAFNRIEPEKTLPSVTLPRWISFTVSLAEVHANEIEQIANAIEEPIEGNPTGLEKALIRAKELIGQHCVIENHPSHLTNHFDMSEVLKGTKFITLYIRWKNRLIRDRKTEYLNIDWWSEICNQMTLAMAAYSAREINTPLKSVAEEPTWYLPVVTHKTTIPAQKKVEFGISLIRIPQHSDFVKVTVPNLS